MANENLRVGKVEPLFFVRAKYADVSVTRYLPWSAVQRARDPWRRVVGRQVELLADDLFRNGLWTKSKRRRIQWTAGIERGRWRG